MLQVTRGRPFVWAVGACKLEASWACYVISVVIDRELVRHLPVAYGKGGVVFEPRRKRNNARTERTSGGTGYFGGRNINGYIRVRAGSRDRFF